MNIFYLHHIAPIAAEYHCDKHVGKMIIETAQLLAAAHHLHGNGDKVSYKLTHQNHPSSIWARSSPAHYKWLATLGQYLGYEFYRRYGKRHKSADVIANELMLPPPALQAMPYTWCPPTLAMPDEYKSNDAVESYRNFYASKANRMPMVYRQGKQLPPAWLTDIWQSQHKEAA